MVYELFLIIFVNIIYIHMVFFTLDDYFNYDNEFSEVMTPKIYLVIHFASVAAMMQLGKYEEFYKNLLIFVIISTLFIRKSTSCKKRVMFITSFSLIGIISNLLKITLYKIYDIEQVIFVDSQMALVFGVLFLNIFF